MSFIDDSQSVGIEASDRALVLGQELVDEFKIQLSGSTDEVSINTVSKPVKDAEVIYEYVKKFNIESVNIANLQKLNEKELINVPFFQKLRKLFTKDMIKSHLMTALGIRTSYTGFHEFMKGDREDLPSVGICSIAKTVGYNILILPIPEDLNPVELARLNVYREEFLEKVEQKISEQNIPTTRSKSSKKTEDKPKEINSTFINNLSIDAGTLIDQQVYGNSTIGEHTTFDDDGGKFNYDLPTTENEIVMNNPLHLDTPLDNGFVLNGDIPFVVDMTGYDDGLGSDFGKVINEEDVEFESFFETNKK